MPILTTKRKLDRLDKEYKEILEYYEAVDFNTPSGGGSQSSSHAGDKKESNKLKSQRMHRLLEEEGEDHKDKFHDVRTNISSRNLKGS